jgi:transcription antitermination factor NusG
MPVLPLEPFLQPEHLFSESFAAANEDEQWWVLHTRPRAEKTIARRLHREGRAYFLPLLTRAPRRRNKPQAHVPLFPSYLFLFGSREARLAALATNQLVQVIPVTDQARLYADLCNVYRLMISDAPLTREDRLLPGMPVEIAHGAFTGLQGKIIRRGASWRLFVEVNFLKCGVSVEVEQWMVKPLDKASPALPSGLRRIA